MKILLASLLIFLPSLLNAQLRITILDRNEENQLLFDESNPKSLISLIKTNEIPMSPMSWEQSNRLGQMGHLKNVATKLGPISDLPMTAVNGEDSMKSVGDFLEFVYPPRDTFYVDFHEISRFIVYESMGQNSMYSIGHIELAKKYEPDGKFEVVGSFEYPFIDSLYTLFYKEQLSSNILNSLINEGLWEELKAYQIDENPMIEKPLLNFNSTFCGDYNPYILDFLQPNRIKTIVPFQNRETWLSECNKLDRFDRYGWELYYGYDKVHGFEGLQPDIPIATVDGQDSMVIGNGVMQFVYSPAEFYPTWIDTIPSKAYLLYQVGEMQSKLKRILFTTGENNELLADLNCENPKIEQFVTLLSKTGIPLHQPETETWKSTFISNLNSSKKFYTSNPRDVKKLRKKLAE